MTEQQKTTPIALTEWQKDVLRDVVKAAMPLVDEWLVAAGLKPPPIPTDPRERALYLRKHRNTGPGKPIQEQRRKR